MKKITEQDLQGKGVIGLPDTPGLSREQMQEKFEETARQVIVPAFNALVDELGGAQGASAIGISPINGFNAKNVQEAVQVTKNKTDELTSSLAEQGASLTQQIDAQGNTLNAKIDAQDASLSAEIAAQETELKQYVDATVQKIGAADMQAIVYDPTHKAQDIFAYADAIGIEAKEYAAGIVAETAPSRLFVLACTTTGTTHALTGLNGAQGLLTCAFTADADFAEGNVFTVDGNAYAVKMQDGSNAKAGLFVVGAKVQVLIDTEGQTVNFKAGGGKGGMKKFFFSAVSGDSTTNYVETTFSYEGTPVYLIVGNNYYLNSKPSAPTAQFSHGLGTGFQAANKFTSNQMSMVNAPGWYGGAARFTFDYENHTLTIGIKSGYESTNGFISYIAIAADLFTEE